MGRWIAAITAALTMLVAIGLFVIMAITCMEALAGFWGRPVGLPVRLIIFAALLGLMMVLHHLTEALKILGAACLVGMMALTCVDVVGRYFGHPVFGSVELVIFMAALATGLALPYTHAVKGHIGVEVFVRLLSTRAQQVIELCTNAAGLALMVLISWQMLVYAETMKASGQVSMNLELPEHLIILVLAFCFVVFSLLIVKEVAVNSMAILKDVFGGPVPDTRGGK